MNTLKTVFNGVVDELSVPSAAAMTSVATSVPFNLGSCFALGILGVDGDGGTPILEGDLGDFGDPLVLDGTFEGDVDGDMIGLGAGIAFNSPLSKLMFSYAYA